MTKEFLITGNTRLEAMEKLLSDISKYTSDITKWEFKTPPEAQQYEGKSKRLAGKWRAYARISFQ